MMRRASRSPHSPRSYCIGMAKDALIGGWAGLLWTLHYFRSAAPFENNLNALLASGILLLCICICCFLIYHSLLFDCILRISDGGLHVSGLRRLHLYT